MLFKRNFLGYEGNETISKLFADDPSLGTVRLQLSILFLERFSKHPLQRERKNLQYRSTFEHISCDSCIVCTITEK